MRLGYELSNGSAVLTIATACTQRATEAVRNLAIAVSSLSWSFLYIVQEALLLENLLVITEWISNTLTPSSLENLSAIASISIHSSWSSQLRRLLLSTSFTSTTTKITHSRRGRRYFQLILALQGCPEVLSRSSEPQGSGDWFKLLKYSRGIPHDVRQEDLQGNTGWDWCSHCSARADTQAWDRRSQSASARRWSEAPSSAEEDGRLPHPHYQERRSPVWHGSSHHQATWEEQEAHVLVVSNHYMHWDLQGKNKLWGITSGWGFIRIEVTGHREQQEHGCQQESLDMATTACAYRSYLVQGHLWIDTISHPPQVHDATTRLLRCLVLHWFIPFFLNIPINYPSNEPLAGVCLNFQLQHCRSLYQVSSCLYYSSPIQSTRYWWHPSSSSSKDFGRHGYRRHCAYSCLYLQFNSNSSSEFHFCSNSPCLGYRSVLSDYSLSFGLYFCFSGFIWIDPDLLHSCFHSSWSVYFDHRGGHCYCYWSLVSGYYWFRFGSLLWTSFGSIRFGLTSPVKASIPFGSLWNCYLDLIPRTAGLVLFLRSRQVIWLPRLLVHFRRPRFLSSRRQ